MKKCFFLPITKKAGRRAQYLYENKTKKKKREGKTATTSVPRHRATARTNTYVTRLYAATLTLTLGDLAMAYSFFGDATPSI